MRMSSSKRPLMPSMSFPRWTWASKISTSAGSSRRSSSSYDSKSFCARSSTSSIAWSLRRATRMAAVAEQVLIYADTERSPELRHELPVAIGDPFLYAENNGSRYVLTNVLEIEKMKKLGIETRLADDYGIDELLKSGKKPREIRNEVLLRACRDLGITNAAVPWGFPLDVADFLRENGVELRPDEELFDDRRRSK